MSAGTWRPVMYVPLSHHYMQPAIDPEAEWPGFYERLRQHAERADKQKRLCKAVYQGDEDEVIRMLKEGFDPNSSYSAPLLRDTRMSALELAVLTQQSLIVNLLLFSRADPMHNKYDGSPLPSFVPNNPSITIVGTAQPRPGFNGLLNLLELTHPADSPSHEMTRLWLEVARWAQAQLAALQARLQDPLHCDVLDRHHSRGDMRRGWGGRRGIRGVC